MATGAVDIGLDASGDLARDPVTGDLALVSGRDLILQLIRIALQFFLNEWFLDETAGVPYFQSILVKNPNMTTVREAFRDVLLNVPGVTAVKALSFNYTRDQRKLNVYFVVATDEGDITSTETVGA